MGCHFLLQRIFPTQGLNLLLLHWQAVFFTTCISWEAYVSMINWDNLLFLSACNAGDPSSIPGSGRSTEEGIGYPLQYSWASLLAQLVKNPPAMWETWVWSLGWEDLLEKGKATHCSNLAWRIPWTVKSTESQRVRDNWATCAFTFTLCLWRRMPLFLTKHILSYLRVIFATSFQTV